MAPLLRHDDAMDLTPFVDRVRQELLVNGDVAGDEGRVLAERLVAPLDSAIRLAMLHALSTATDEITRELAPGSVELRLRGVEPSFVVAPAPAESWAQERGARTAPSTVPAADDDGATARINFRPPEHLKARIEEAAAGDGLSVNAWLVRAVSGVLGDSRAERRTQRDGNALTGWVS
jgi:hypothetical protein